MKGKPEDATELPLSRPGRQVPDRRAGCGKGKIWIADDFDDPLPDELLEAFSRGPIEPPA